MEGQRRAIALGLAVQPSRERRVTTLLTDDRLAAGPQQSEFVRGACWISALSGVQ